MFPWKLGAKGMNSTKIKHCSSVYLHKLSIMFFHTNYFLASLTQTHTLRQKKNRKRHRSKQTSVSRSEEKSVKELGEWVRKVLKENKAERSCNPTLAFISRKPNGHPSSNIHNINCKIRAKLSTQNLYRERERERYQLNHAWIWKQRVE